ncbi:MAG TPA: AMP-binding protein, partial [Caulobacteraceae bacterium]
MNLVEAFLEHAEARPDAPALIGPDGRVITYADLARLSAARAAAFARAGIGVGDVVLIARGVSPDLYAALLAVFRLGAVAMFPEPAAGLKGLAIAIDAARPKALVAGPKARALRPFTSLRRLPVLPEPPGGGRAAGPLAATSADTPALITFTSGSTARPKGIVRTAGFLRLQHEIIETLRRTEPGHVDLISLPVFILSNLLAGAASVIPAGNLRRPAALRGAALRAQMARHAVNRVLAPPAVCARLVDGGATLPGVEAVFTGGGPVFPNLLHALKRAARQAAIHAAYGSTEAEPIAHVEYDQITDADWAGMSSGSGLLAGLPVPEIRAEIRNHEIQVSGPHVNGGYLDPADDATTKVNRDGRLWHRTGDAGRFDEHGRLWLLGRR